MKNKVFFTLIMGFLVGCASQGEKEGSQQNEKKIVYVSNYPLYYFTERMAPSTVVIRFPASKASDPAFGNPSLIPVWRCRRPT